MREQDLRAEELGHTHAGPSETSSKTWDTCGITVLVCPDSYHSAAEDRAGFNPHRTPQEVSTGLTTLQLN